MEDWESPETKQLRRQAQKLESWLGIVVGILLLFVVFWSVVHIERAHSADLPKKDRFQSMGSKEEFCVYKTKLMVGVVFYLNQGTKVNEIPILWHGDETENEKKIVLGMAAEADKIWHAKKETEPKRYIDPYTFGDEQYLACMSAKNT